MMALKKYAIFYETGLTDAGDDLIIMGYIGEERKRDDHYAVIQTATCSSIKIVSERYLMIGHREVMKQTWERLAHTSSILSSQEWKQLDLHDGVPAIYPETSGKFLPHEINLEKLGAIHFDKGCYTGQEIIARMHYRGKLKKHMHQATILSQSPPLPGSDVYSQQGQEIKMSGVIVDVCLSTKNNNHYDALIIIDGSDAKNHHLFLDKNAVASERVFLCLGTVHK
jgi:folate-binding protein YgfZ